jgi:hypothetical protein
MWIYPVFLLENQKNMKKAPLHNATLCHASTLSHTSFGCERMSTLIPSLEIKKAQEYSTSQTHQLCAIAHN